MSTDNSISSSLGISKRESSRQSLSIRRKRQRGFVLITMAAAAICLIAVLGLAIDMGHTFIVKNETQAFVDAAALAATLQLNGQDTGITQAKAAVTTMTTRNKWNFATTAVPSPTVQFATVSTGPWLTTPSPATGYKYARVQSAVSVPLYFIPVVRAFPAYTQTVNSQAIAGQIDVTTIGIGLSPYSGVSTNTTGPNFGMVVGGEYSIQWAHFTGNGNGCSAAHPEKCFQGNGLCGNAIGGDTDNGAAWAVASNWSSSFSGYWGATSNSVIEAYTLGSAQLEAISVSPPTNIYPVLTTGQKNSEGGWLDWKVNHDTDSTDTTWADYSTALANGTANGQRLLTVPVLDPVDATTTNAIGYAQFMLETNHTPSDNYTKLNGNQAWCAIYAGPLDLGSVTPGVGGSSGAAVTKLVY
jgi:Flp pilus assembly protein TadG